MQRIANPFSPVRLWVAPPKTSENHIRLAGSFGKRNCQSWRGLSGLDRGYRRLGFEQFLCRSFDLGDKVAAGFADVTVGSNFTVGGSNAYKICCVATTGYETVTGLGVPLVGAFLAAGETLPGGLFVRNAHCRPERAD